MSVAIVPGAEQRNRKREPVNGPRQFVDMLRNGLEDRAWQEMDPHIAHRFAPRNRRSSVLRYSGRMQWVYCSPVGLFIARILKPFSILPDACARNSEFFFRISRSGDFVLKRRVYRLPDGQQFVFESRFSDTPRLHEEFGGGLGMYLRLAVKSGALLFRDNGYFLRLKDWRIPLPRWLTVGRFELLHRNIDARRFQIIIRLSHPLFGTLFYQRGLFQDQNTLPRP